MMNIEEHSEEHSKKKKKTTYWERLEAIEKVL